MAAVVSPDVSFGSPRFPCEFKGTSVSCWRNRGRSTYDCLASVASLGAYLSVRTTGSLIQCQNAQRRLVIFHENNQTRNKYDKVPLLWDAQGKDALGQYEAAESSFKGTGKALLFRAVAYRWPAARPRSQCLLSLDQGGVFPGSLFFISAY